MNEDPKDAEEQKKIEEAKVEEVFRKAAVQLMFMVCETIRKNGPIPSGPLYACLMEFVSYEAYMKMLESLKKIKLVREDGMHQLHWIGPIIHDDATKAVH